MTLTRITPLSGESAEVRAGKEMRSRRKAREAVLQAYANVTVESLERLSPEVSGVFATDDHGLDGAESSEKRNAV